MILPSTVRFSMPIAMTALVTVAALVTGPATALADPRLAPLPGSVQQVAGLNGCYTVDGTSAAGPATCTNIRGGIDTTTIKISRNGTSAYVVGYRGSAGALDEKVPVLSVFSRNVKTGVLSQLPGKAGCLSDGGSSEDGPHTCTKVRDLGTGDATSIAISADGRSVYVASQNDGPHDAVIGGVAVFSRNPKTGALHQLAGLAGCVSAGGLSNEGAHTCTASREVESVSNVHLTPDQRFLYASTYDSQPNSGIAIFSRDLKTGALHQLGGPEGCVTDNGTTASSKGRLVCRAMPNLGDPWDVATPDNKFVYIPDRNDDLVQTFRRDAKGGLVPLTGLGACVSDTGNSPLGPGTCVAGRGLFDVERAVLSKNNAFIYTNSFRVPSPIAVLNRNHTTGLLSQRSGTAACYSQDGTSGDTAPPCRNGRALGGGYAGVLSLDGNTLYYAEEGTTGDPLGGLVIFHVNENMGGFTQLVGTLGCVTPDASSEDGAGTCQKARAVRGGYQVAIAPGASGYDLYVAGSVANGVDFLHATP